MNDVNVLSWPAALDRIKQRAERVDTMGEWPEENFSDLYRAGAMGWSIPKSFSGSELSSLDLHRHYQEMSAACLTTALVFTQRDAAVEFLVAAQESTLARKLLVDLAENRIFASIGIAQLTTSGRHQGAALLASAAPGGFKVNGIIPWATGVHHAHWLIVGARIDDQNQILFALSMDRAGIKIDDCVPMASLNGSDTASVKLQDVVIRNDEVLSGPCEDALAQRGNLHRFTLNTCVVPLGVAAGAIAEAEKLAALRNDKSQETILMLRQSHQALEQQIYACGTDTGIGKESRAAIHLRARANDLAMRSALACLELAKGRGMLIGNPAQRRVREAMFFFVWSSSPAVIQETLFRLAGLDHRDSATFSTGSQEALTS
ncbi:MAG TPA: acyl-CoA dehydrogenase family protein [Phycisphaerae bacterium]|nr:acyl-CoA dehydrogenase family protein [Phycisphaerae bacterium]